MRNVDILAAFETEIDLIDDIQAKPATDDSMYWLNQAVNKFVKIRFNGDFVHKQGYEQTEKRRHDLIKLVTMHIVEGNKIDESEDINKFEVDKSHINYESYFVTYPTDFLFELSENVIISDINGEHKMDTCAFECTQDSFMYRVNNSLTDFHYRFHKARPLRIRNNDGCELLTDGNYIINMYSLTYLRKPKEITLKNPLEQYEDFEDATIYEIVKIAAQMYLENTKSDRYKTISEEVLTQE